MVGTEVSDAAGTGHCSGLNSMEGHHNMMSSVCSKSEHDGSLLEELSRDMTSYVDTAFWIVC